MIAFDAQIFGDKEFLQSLYGFPKALRRRTIEAIQQSARMTAESIRGNELSGGVLNARTRKLQRSMFVKVDEHSDQLVAAVYPKARYGWMLGQGTPKNEVTVKAFTRRVKSADTFATGKKGQLTKKRLGMGITFVEAHTRKMILARVARPFMGPGYERMKARIEARLKEAMVLAQQDMLEGLDVEEFRGGA